jgi:glutathione S-transferase
MPITLQHHPYSRANHVVWMLEEVGVEYQLEFVDLLTGAHKTELTTRYNPMGKLPTLIDGDTVVTEKAAIALYLGDRYAYGRLAPKVDDPARATYYRWSFFAPSVIEPATMAKLEKWEVRASNAGWGDYESTIRSMESAIAGKDFVLGKDFSMADTVFGGTVVFFLDFKILEPRPLFTAYAERLRNRPAFQRSEEKNAAIRKAHGLDKG